MATNNNDTPKWAKELSADMRAFMALAEEDRKQAAKDREQAAEDRKVAAEDRKQATGDRRSFAAVATKIGMLIVKTLNNHTELLKNIQKDSKVQIRLLNEILRTLKTQSNGRWNNKNLGGNGHKKNN